ncbi:MAG: 2,3-bisphosphoglycerate-independent phosphoglycerate mutase [Spirochaetes bacterium]|nr:2,3-bisphosphoglycerate-independent phosphoglycerate mutase [Spirochaetota bacterium]
MRKKIPYMLLIRDGWGFNPKKEYNAIELCNPENHNYFLNNFPTVLIEASGLAVGLPEGNQGSSEVGHLNMGAGRIVYQNLVKISKEIDEKTFFKNEALLKSYEHAIKYNSNIHIYGLVQDQGVHAHTKHLLGYLEFFRLKNYNGDKIYIHIISDGRDTLPKSTYQYVKEVEEYIHKFNFGKIISITGRYYAMDRDNRWERVKLFYDMLVYGKSDSNLFNDVYSAIDDAYNNNETDEFIKPRIIKGFKVIQDNDLIIFFNYRFDRAREITKAFIHDDFKEFETKKINNLCYLCTTEYYENIQKSNRAKVFVTYPLENLTNIMGEWISKKGLKQLRIAETEKFAHVTFFFNGQQDTVYEGEDRILIPSPKVPTYDLKPEMSAYEVTENILNALDKDIYDFIVLNYANPDMVGHTGVLEAAIKACKTVDICVGKVVNKVLEKEGIVFLTSDHGNAEQMIDYESGKPYTAHTSNPVWFTIISKLTHLQKDKIKLRNDGKLADISPTILYTMGIDIPSEMDGNILFK